MIKIVFSLFNIYYIYKHFPIH